MLTGLGSAELLDPKQVASPRSTGDRLVQLVAKCQVSQDTRVDRLLNKHSSKLQGDLWRHRAVNGAQLAG